MLLGQQQQQSDGSAYPTCNCCHCRDNVAWHHRHSIVASAVSLTGAASPAVKIATACVCLAAPVQHFRAGHNGMHMCECMCMRTYGLPGRLHAWPGQKQECYSGSTGDLTDGCWHCSCNVTWHHRESIVANVVSLTGAASLAEQMATALTCMAVPVRRFRASHYVIHVRVHVQAIMWPASKPLGQKQ